MSEGPEIRDLLASMVEREVDLDGAEFRVDRQRVIARMIPRRRRNSRTTRAVAVLAAAAMLLVTLGMRLSKRDKASSGDSLEVIVSEGSATQSRDALRTTIEPQQSLHIASLGELETAAESKALLRTDDGLQLDLGGETRISLGELRSKERQVTLSKGVLRCKVPHRASPSARGDFRVVAPDVIVIDLGTAFTVDVDGVNHTTRVSVEEGEVIVRHSAGDTHVRAPGTWTRAPSVPTQAPLQGPTLDSVKALVAPTAPAPPTASSIKGSSSAARQGATQTPQAATLNDEARLLRQGLSAEREGRFSDASSALRQLVTKYPQSPLAPDARAALTRIEARGPR